MPTVTWGSVAADVEFQLNMLLSDTISQAQNTYARAEDGTQLSGDPIVTDWVVAQVKKHVIDAEYQVATEICMNERHPERGDFQSTSSALSSGVALPTNSSDAKVFLGPFDFARDSSTSQIMVPRALDVVRMAINNANSAFSTPYRPLVWCAAGGTFLHNGATTAVLVGAALNRGTYVATDFIRVRDHNRPAIVAGAIANICIKEGVWPELFEQANALWAGYVASIRAVGKQMVEPAPAQV